MTPQEQKLVEELLGRLKQAPAQLKDPDADRLIRRGVAETPDAPYLLVQTVLIQDMALSEAQRRVDELEKHLAESEAARAQSSRPSFLGSALARSSVTSPGPWGRAPQSAASAPQSASGSIQNAVGPTSFGGAAAATMAPSASSGFLRAAAATALGVAGGQLLFQGIESMFGHQTGMLSGQAVQPALSETVVSNFYGNPAGSPGGPALAGSDSDHDTSDPDLDSADAGSDDSFDGSDSDLT